MIMYALWSSRSASSGRHSRKLLSPVSSLNLLVMVTMFLIIVTLTSRVSCAPSSGSTRDGRSLVSSVAASEAAPTFWTTMATRMFELFNAKKVFEDIKLGRTTLATCNVCLFGMRLMQNFAANGRGRDDFVSLAHSMCVSLNIETPRVCRGVVDLFADEFVTVMTSLVISPSEVCGILLGESCARVSNPLHNWSIPLTPFPKPSGPPAPSTDTPSSSKAIKILHLSDTHIDPEYRYGANVKCGEPLCCRDMVQSGELPSHLKAGYWGDYRDCDIPMRTFESMLKYISTHHTDIDYVIWTGDIPAHDVWNQTRDAQVSIIRSVSHLMDKYLGSVPILPSLGNHESSPANSFPPPSITGNRSVSWLYDELYDIWSKWLPDYSMSHIKHGAYYSVYLRDKLKLISLNMNYCNNLNWWLLLNSTDPADELSWMIRELQASELMGERVAIIGHIPPGTNDCLQVWSRNYYKIINRYEHTIIGQFFGHTHQDEYELFYDDDKSATSPVFSSLRATSIAYIAPSTTTFGRVNPGYRIYTLDSSSYNILDHETYFVNLTLANERPSTELAFQLSYSAKRDLNLTDLTPPSWHRFILNMIQDDQLFHRYESIMSNQADGITHCRTSDFICKADLLCRLITGKAHDYSLCQKLLNDRVWSTSSSLSQHHRSSRFS